MWFYQHRRHSPPLSRSSQNYTSVKEQFLIPAPWKLYKIGPPYVLWLYLSLHRTRRKRALSPGCWGTSQIISLSWREVAVCKEYSTLLLIVQGLEGCLMQGNCDEGELLWRAEATAGSCASLPGPVDVCAGALVLVRRQICACQLHLWLQCWCSLGFKGGCLFPTLFPPASCPAFLSCIPLFLCFQEKPWLTCKNDPI